MSEVGTQKDKLSTPLVERVQAYEGEKIGKSVFSITLSRDGEGKLVPEATDFTLSRKAASEIQGARTVNRHR